MNPLQLDTRSTKRFFCPKVKHVETVTVKNVSFALGDCILEQQTTTGLATYPIIIDCTGLQSCGIKNSTRTVDTISWEDCSFNTSRA